MSKFHYLIALLLLSIIGYITVWQLRLVTGSAVQLISVEIVKKIDMRLQQVSRELKRVPDSDQEFALLVLGTMDFSSRYPRIAFHNFMPGSRVAPAFFQVFITSAAANEPIVFQVVYYGNDYQANLAFKGKLVKQ